MDLIFLYEVFGIAKSMEVAGLVAHTFNLSAEKQRQVDLCGVCSQPG